MSAHITSAEFTFHIGVYNHKKKKHSLADRPKCIDTAPQHIIHEPFGCCEKYTPTPIPTAAKITIKVIKKHIHRFRRAARACFTAMSTSATLDSPVISTSQTMNPTTYPFLVSSSTPMALVSAKAIWSSCWAINTAIWIGTVSMVWVPREKNKHH